MTKTNPFDQHSSDYDQWFVENPYVYLSEIAAIRHFLPKSGKHIEIGVGSGRFAMPLNISLGIDPSEKMLKLAQQRKINAVKAVAEYLPIKDNLFDSAIMITTLCFLEDLNKAFQETRRILKIGSTFILGLIDRDSPLGKIYQAHKQHNIFYRQATFYSTHEIIVSLRKNKFKNIETVQTILGKLTEIETIQSFKNGYGEGGFVVIKANL